MRTVFTNFTLFLYEYPQKRMSRRHRLAKVVVIVNRQQVPVDVGVANHHLHISNAVDVEYELVELLKLARLDPV